jgi:hypothetical protein
MKKKIMIAVILISVLSFVVVLLVSYIPHKIDIDYKAVVYDSNTGEFICNTTIKMKGKLHNPLFSNAKYSGSLVIDYYDMTKTKKPEIVFFKNSWKQKIYFGIVNYPIYKGIECNFNSIGVMHLSSNMDSICIYAYSQQDIDKFAKPNDGVESTSLIIAAPAQTLKEAKQIAAKLEK